jgi:predicted DNA-binding protein
MNVYKEGRMMKEQLISARVSAEVKQRLETAAHEERRSLSNYVALVLEQHVAERLPSGLEKLRNVTFAKQEEHQRGSTQATDSPENKLFAEALERLKNGTFTKEEAHRFLDQGLVHLNRIQKTSVKKKAEAR